MTWLVYAACESTGAADVKASVETIDSWRRRLDALRRRDQDGAESLLA